MALWYVSWTMAQVKKRNVLQHTTNNEPLLSKYWMLQVIFCSKRWLIIWKRRCHHSRDRMVVGLKLHMQSVPITTNILHRRGLLDTTLSDKVSQWFATGWWFSPVFSTNKTDRHDDWNIVESGVKHHKPNQPTDR